MTATANPAAADYRAVQQMQPQPPPEDAAA